MPEPTLTAPPDLSNPLDLLGEIWRGRANILSKAPSAGRALASSVMAGALGGGNPLAAAGGGLASILMDLAGNASPAAKRTIDRQVATLGAVPGPMALSLEGQPLSSATFTNVWQDLYANKFPRMAKRISKDLNLDPEDVMQSMALETLEKGNPLTTTEDAAFSSVDEYKNWLTSIADRVRRSLVSETWQKQKVTESIDAVRATSNGDEPARELVAGAERALNKTVDTPTTFTKPAERAADVDTRLKALEEVGAPYLRETRLQELTAKMEGLSNSAIAKQRGVTKQTVAENVASSTRKVRALATGAPPEGATPKVFEGYISQLKRDINKHDPSRISDQITYLPPADQNMVRNYLKYEFSRIRGKYGERAYTPLQDSLRALLNGLNRR